MLQSILSNIAIILMMHLSMTALMNFERKIKRRILKCITILLISGSVIAMFYLPIRFGNYWVDMRFVPLIFVAYLQGWKPAIPALLITSFWRFLMGGDGMVPGVVFGMVLPTLFTLAFHQRSKIKKNYVEKIGIIIACWLISDLPIIFIIPNGIEIFFNTAFVRSTSFVVTAIILYSLIMQDRQRRFLYVKLEKLAGEDPLTRLLNKRKFLEVMDDKLQTLAPNHFIAMLDIDHFKRINDTYGHLVGDSILVRIGEILHAFESNHLKVGRYGGEEFIIYIGNSNFERTKDVIKNIQQEIRNTSFHIDHKETLHVTVSIGFSNIDENSPLIQSINKADKNLYKAKRNGRDCLICS